MNPIIFNLYGSSELYKKFSHLTKYEEGKISIHTFPDSETSIIFESDVRNRELIFFATLDRPNTKALPLIFAAENAKSLGATSIGLIAPYLAYMREDKQFVPSGSITSHYFSALLSNHFSWLITVDPHLHRIHDLGEVYTILINTKHAHPF